LAELAKIMGIEKDNVISVGDNQNDLEMIKVSEQGLPLKTRIRN